MNTQRFMEHLLPIPSEAPCTFLDPARLPGSLSYTAPYSKLVAEFKDAVQPHYHTQIIGTGVAGNAPGGIDWQDVLSATASTTDPTASARAEVLRAHVDGLLNVQLDRVVKMIFSRMDSASAEAPYVSFNGVVDQGVAGLGAVLIINAPPADNAIWKALQREMSLYTHLVECFYRASSEWYTVINRGISDAVICGNGAFCIVSDAELSKKMKESPDWESGVLRSGRPSRATF